MALGKTSHSHELGVTTPATPVALRDIGKKKYHEKGINPRTGHRLTGIR
jgi:hypothetical protein